MGCEPRPVDGGFFKEFVEDYERVVGKSPVLNPQLRFKRCANDVPSRDVALTAEKRLPPDGNRRPTIGGGTTTGRV